MGFLKDFLIKGIMAHYATHKAQPNKEIAVPGVPKAMKLIWVVQICKRFPY